MEGSDPTLSLYHLLDPEVLANPYPLFRRLRTEDPVHWDPFLHTWVVTRYADVVEVKKAGGLSTGAKIAIGLGIGVAVLALVAIHVKNHLFDDFKPFSQH